MYEMTCEEFQQKIPGLPSYSLASTEIKDVLLKAADYGVPQMRERIFLVGINDEYENCKFEYPPKTHGINCDLPYVSVADALMDLPTVNTKEENNVYDFNFSQLSNGNRVQFLRRMRGDLSMVPNHIVFNDHSLSSHKGPGHTKKMMHRIKLILQGENMKSAYDRLKKEDNIELFDEYFPNKLYSARNRRLRADEPSFTVTSHCLDEMIHPFSDRALTPREAARLQSFPDWYQFKGPYVKFHSDVQQDRYEQIGDAIPPLLAYALAEQIVKTLNSSK